MPRHTEHRVLPYSPEQVFNLVADVDAYPQFLPWCLGARITKREGTVFYADLIIGWKLIRERFRSKVELDAPKGIHVEYIEGPMRYLHNQWDFSPTADGGCAIDFYVDFEFRSRTLERLMGVLFNEAVRRMVGAFEARARALYGPPGGVTAPQRA